MKNIINQESSKKFMISLSLLVFALSILLASFQTLADSTIAKRSSVSAPHGSYRRSCKNIHVKRHHLVNFNLYATCRNHSGHWIHSKYKRFRRCHGDIANHNGHLRCVARTTHHPAPVVHIPDGSYRQSCRTIHIKGHHLTARCNDGHGHYGYTKLHNYRKCHGDIRNSRGRLYCARRRVEHHAPVSHIPRGSYKHSCRNVHVRHGNLSASCRNNHGRWHHSKLHNYRGCHGDIGNHNGRLSCSR